MYRRIRPNGLDQVAALQAIWDRCVNGDTIRLAGNTRSTFLVGSQLNWIGKDVHIEAMGCTIRGTNGFAGPPVLYGANRGQRNGATLHWRGGYLLGGLVLQNVSYSTIEPDVISGTLELRFDTVSAYNEFHIPGGIAGGSVCVLINQLAVGAWANSTEFRKTPMDPTTGGTVLQFTTSEPPTWGGPDSLLFDHCSFESGGAISYMFNASYFTSAVFRDCYFENPLGWQIGTLAEAAQIALVGPHGVPWWGSDSRFAILNYGSGQ